ncbi:F-box protein At5g51380-like [Prosopis cineraria]|uniref:F-box protein At5g51380-like n=1 Tax=Prosopis cineraria TaxID=364024 RepID=UPI002410A629|nr:F-box protein At5g51380-like [Prosopis cineraria]
MSFEWADLPRECWELILRSLKHRRDYDSVSLVCKEFYSITRRLHSSLTIYDSTFPFLPRFFVRFPALKFIDLSNFTGDLNPVLAQISKSRLALDSLNISNQNSLPIDGLQKLGSKMRNYLRVLICSGICDLQDSDLVLIADSFPLLEELHIGFPEFDPKFTVSDSGFTALTMRLKSLRTVKIDAGLPLSKLILRKCSDYTYSGISCLLAKCQSVQYLDLQNANLIDQDMRELSLFLRNVTFINLSFCSKLTNSTFLTLTRNCPVVSEIRMERTDLGTEGLKEDYLNDFVVHSQVKRLFWVVTSN